MSEHGYTVVVEHEALSTRRLVTILVIGVFVICACAIVVKLWLPARRPVETTLSGLHQRIGPLEQTLILAVHTNERKLEDERERLDRYSWVDRKKGIVAIPIDRAMQLVEEGGR